MVSAAMPPVAVPFGERALGVNIFDTGCLYLMGPVSLGVVLRPRILL